MTEQLNLFDAPKPELKPKDPNVKPAAVPRLSRQCKAIDEKIVPTDWINQPCDHRAAELLLAAIAEVETEKGGG